MEADGQQSKHRSPSRHKLLLHHAQAMPMEPSAQRVMPRAGRNCCVKENTAAELSPWQVRAGSSKPSSRARLLHHHPGPGRGRRAGGTRSGSGARAGTVVIGGRSRRCSRWPRGTNPITPRAGSRNIPNVSVHVCRGKPAEAGAKGPAAGHHRCPRGSPSQEAARYWWK